MATQPPPNSRRQHMSAPYPMPLPTAASNSNVLPPPHTPVREHNVSSSTPQLKQFGQSSRPLPYHGQTGNISLPRQPTQTTNTEQQGGMTFSTSNMNSDSTSDSGSDHTMSTWVTEVDSIRSPVNDPSKITPPRARLLSNIATHLVYEAPKSEQCIVIGVGDKQRVQDYATETRRNIEARSQMRKVHVRALLDLIQTALGYEALPYENGAAKGQGHSSTVSSVVTELIITRSEHLHFLRSNSQNIYDVHAIAKLHTREDANLLLNTLSLNRDELNSAAHDINIRCTLELIMWMRKETTKSIALTIGWPDTSSTPRYINVFCTAVKALLPPACQGCYARSPTEAIKVFGDTSLKNYVREHRTHKYIARKLWMRTQAWGIQLLNEKRAAFFKWGQNTGHCTSGSQLDKGLNILDEKKLDKIELNKELNILDEKKLDKIELNKELNILDEKMNRKMEDRFQRLAGLWKMRHPEDEALLTALLESEAPNEGGNDATYSYL